MLVAQRLRSWPQFDALLAQVPAAVWWGAAAAGLVALAIALGWWWRSRQTRSVPWQSSLQATYDAIREAILVVDRQGRAVSHNRQFAELLGPPADDAAALADALAAALEPHEAFGDFWREMSASSATAKREFSLRGRRRFVTVYTAPLLTNHNLRAGRVWSFDDITERKELESSLMQSQKMEAIGRLAGGIAHDFNNLLMAISGNLELSRMVPTRAVADVAQPLNAAEQAIERAAKLIRNLLGFSRQSTLELQVCNPNQVVERLGELLKHTLNPGISLRWSLQPSLWSARLDETQLQQVLLNICLNARDALRNESGTIEITTENTTSHEGDFVKLTISDNGVGMSKDVQDKIFEPFFTTKPHGHGTGLGLAMSYGIIRQHAGQISCESEVGRGTTFSILLPRCDSADEVQATDSDAPPQGTQAPPGRILLGEDSHLVRDSIASILRSEGYQVTAVANGHEVIAAFTQDGPYDAAIVDLSMPLMSGQETFVALRQLNPGLPIIICSGYTFDVNEFIEQTGEAPASFVHKPFRKVRLLAALRGAIESAAPTRE